MLLFIVSFFLIFASSYFITSIITPKKSILGFIYLFVIAFAQIVLTFEILSLFTAIKQFWVLFINVQIFAFSIYLWNKKSKPFWTLDLKEFRRKLINAFKLDISLMVLFSGFCVLIFSAAVLCFLMPITNLDAQAYHVARSLFWVLQGSLNHFEVADIRNLCLPINSEILYAWVLLFVKKDVFLGFFSFVGYLLSIVSIYNILGLLGYCMRKRLWAIFILSSFASVIVQVSGTETDIIIAGLVLSSVFLFWYGVKNDAKIPVFMSSLAYALALGTKTTSIIAVPAVGLLMLWICYYHKKYKPFALFLGFGLINFIIFSSYNYILNYIQFSDFMGSQSFMVVSKNYYGIRGFFANFIKYCFMFIDVTGLTWSFYFGPYVMMVRDNLLNSLHLLSAMDGLYSTPYVVNSRLLEPVMGFGLLGIIVFLPCLFWSFIKPIFKRHSRKALFLLVFALTLIVNLMAISASLAYMSFSVRFVMFFVVLASPILVYSYFSNNNPLKYIIIFFALFYLICVSTHLWARPFSKLGRIFELKHSITYLRDIATCKGYEKVPEYSHSTCVLRDQLKNQFNKDNRILFFASTTDNIFMIKLLEFQGYKIDFKTFEDVDKIDFNKYNLIITTNEGQNSTVIKDYANRKSEYRIVDSKFVISRWRAVPCVYVANPQIIDMTRKETLYPYEVRCGMSKEFIESKNLVKIGVAGVIKPNVKDYNYYILYMNKNRPIIPKKN